MDQNPYIVGITGHRHLPSGQVPSLTVHIQEFFQEAAARHGAENITVLSQLAEGADTLCAKAALDAGLRLAVPLPMNIPEYRMEFRESAVVELDYLLSMADKVFVVPPEDPVPRNPKRGFYYRQAGIYVARHCDVLLAVWDGVKRDTPDGAGTWESVKLAHRFEKPIHHIAI